MWSCYLKNLKQCGSLHRPKSGFKLEHLFQTQEPKPSQYVPKVSRLKFSSLLYQPVKRTYNLCNVKDPGPDGLPGGQVKNRNSCQQVVL